jgi:DNA repair protein RadD
MALFPYQQKVVDEYEAATASSIRRILIVAPTASGKTHVAAEITKRALENYKRVLFLAHRNELLTQARDRLAEFGITAGIIKAGREKDVRPLAAVQVAGIQTLHRRAIQSSIMELPDADILIVDECHHIRAKTYQALIHKYPNALLIGLTATPCRGDGRGLGNCFDLMLQTPQIGELIKLDFLVPMRIFVPKPPDLRGVEVAKTGDYVISQLSARVNTDVLVGDVVEHYLRHGERRRAICFAVDRAHSVHLMREFLKSSVRAEHLDGETKQNERDAILARLASGETEVVCNCGVLTEGFDCCPVGVIILARPTRSLGLYFQMIGRGLRKAEGKKDCVVMDHAGATNRHGRPDDEIAWTLHSDQRAENKIHERRKREHKDPFCECTKCGHLRQRGFACDNCGWQPKPRGDGIDYIPDDLVEMGKTQRTELDRCTFYRELRGHQRTHRRRDGSQYSPKWPAAQYHDKHGTWQPSSWDAHTPLAPSDATRRWIKSRQIAWAKRKSARSEKSFEPFIF